MCGETEIQAGSLRIRMHQLQTLDSGGTLSGYQQQYQVLYACTSMMLLCSTQIRGNILWVGEGVRLLQSVRLSGCDAAGRTMCIKRSRILLSCWSRAA